VGNAEKSGEHLSKSGERRINTLSLIRATGLQTYAELVVVALERAVGGGAAQAVERGVALVLQPDDGAGDAEGRRLEVELAGLEREEELVGVEQVLAPVGQGARGQNQRVLQLLDQFVVDLLADELFLQVDGWGEIWLGCLVVASDARESCEELKYLFDAAARRLVILAGVTRRWFVARFVGIVLGQRCLIVCKKRLIKIKVFNSMI